MITGFTICRLETTEQPYHRIRFSWVVPAKQLRQKLPASAVIVHQGGETYLTRKLVLAESARRNIRGVA